MILTTTYSDPKATPDVKSASHASAIIDQKCWYNEVVCRSSIVVI